MKASSDSIMSVETLDWDTISLKLENSINDPKINQRNLKESSLSTAVEMQDYKILQYLTKTKGGLITSEFRKVIWPVLLGFELLEDEVEPDWRLLPQHKDEDQVGLDVERSFVYYPQNISSTDKRKLKDDLRSIITRVLRTYPELSYYQGYHDICTVFLLVFEDDLELCFKVLSIFTLVHLRDFMMPNIDVTLKMLKLIPELTSKIDEDLHNDLIMGNLEPFYCLSPIITLFSHDITEFSTICQIFDLIIANGSIGVTIYIYVCLLSNKKDKIFEKISSTQDSDCFSKQDLVHDSLSKFLKNINSSDVSDLMQDLVRYMKSFPLNSLKSFKALSKYSALRTSPIVLDLNKGILESRIKSTDRTLLSKQIEESSKISTMSHSFYNKGFSSFRHIISSKRNQHLLTVSITIGIVSILLNILLNKADTSQLINRIIHLWNHHEHILNIGIRPIREFFMSPL